MKDSVSGGLRQNRTSSNLTGDNPTQIPGAETGGGELSEGTPVHSDDRSTRHHNVDKSL